MNESLSAPLRPHHNLVGEVIRPTLLPQDPAASLMPATGVGLLDAARVHPESSLVWAALAEEALGQGDAAGDVAGYAYARTGYHRGLDSLRRSGWRGSGPVPWEHEPNQGFLRALWALAVASHRFGDAVEADRCAQFLRDSSETGWQELGAH